MKKKFDIDDRNLWVRCEAATGLWLESVHGAKQVTWVNGRPGAEQTSVVERVNKREGAPLVKVDGFEVRSPDFRVEFVDGQTEYWEVKQRSAAWRDEADGTSCFWVSREVLNDYLTLATNGRDVRAVWLIVYEGGYLSGRWYKFEVRLAAQVARYRRFVFSNEETGEAEVVEAVLWPVHEMIEMAFDNRPLLEAAASELGGQSQPPTTTTVESIRRVAESGDRDAQTELDLLSRQIGLKTLPRYSVLYVQESAHDDQRLSQVLSLLEFGIRIFLITDSTRWKSAYGGQPEKLQALIDCFLLEVSIVEGINDVCRGVIEIDGVRTREVNHQMFEDLWAKAEVAGAINTRQYEIVHARTSGGGTADSSTLAVIASAGSGKTETLVERIMFLLATSSRSEPEPQKDRRPTYDLRLDEIVLITFTRESAREMRQRLNRTLVLRRRLCGKCAMPVLAWLTQLGSTNISTIHSYAKKLIQVLGPIVGVAHDFTVGSDHDRFEEALRAAIDDLYYELSEEQRKDLPEPHEVREFVEQVWDALVRNGVNVLNLRDGASEIERLNWASHCCESDWGKRFADLLREAILKISKRYRQVCREQALIPTDQLVSIATDLLRRRPNHLDELRVPRHMFIDEFQDTDGQQIEMALSLQSRGTRLFVVGDPKQGIYRFRGAEGNAFRLLDRLTKSPIRKLGLSRNFRTDGRLLKDLQEVFDRWVAEGQLEMGPDERLEAAHDLAGVGSSIVMERATSSRGGTRDEALEFVQRQIRQWMLEDWHKESKSDERIAVLCRSNWQAIAVKKYLNNLTPSITCEISKGGDFFRARAVSELRVFLRALARPRDVGAVLELMETAWGHAIYAHVEEVDPENPGKGLGRYVSADAVERFWIAEIGSEKLLSWGARLIKRDADRLSSDDLEVLFARLESLSKCMENVPLLELLAEFDLVLKPRVRLQSVGILETERYQRNLDHAYMLIDDAFKDGTISLWQVIEWLDLKSSTDFETDEPDVVSKVDVLAITVHKAKGREFEAVLIPFTDSAFVSDSRTNVSILNRGEERRIGWRWWRGQGKSGTPLESNIDNEFKRRDEDETVKEETRLLYVAMTRAKKKLAIFVDRSSDSPTPRRWADLLS
jgi:DNA helicase-2/ATP-dependent DNA helicase PcrA